MMPDLVYFFRKVLVFIGMILLAFSSIHAKSAAADPGWESFKAEFLSSDGRVIDYGQGEISHSEGQAYALLLAEANNDRPTFDLVLQWTINNLGQRADGMLAWKWGRDDSNRWRILDENNATDGDLIAAFALSRAASRWNEPVYGEKAKFLAQALRENLAREWQGMLFLLPGKTGFDSDGKLIVNPSYIIPKAYIALANIDDRAFWSRCAADGERFLSSYNFGFWGLPADWVELSDSAHPLPGRGEFFSSDAIRVLLVKPQQVRGLASLINYSLREGWLPNRIDLVRDGASLHEAASGAYSVLANAARISGRSADALQISKMAEKRRAGEKKQYYSRVLHLLAETNALR